MKGILIGAMHKQGSFTDDSGEKIDYDNLVLLLQKPMENTNEADRYVEGLGFMTVEAKCPWDKFPDVFDGKIKKLTDLKDVIGCEVSYFFNDKKKLDTVIL